MKTKNEALKFLKDKKLITGKSTMFIITQKHPEKLDKQFELTELLTEFANNEKTDKINWHGKACELGKLLLEARDALPAISLASAKIRNIDLKLADRIEESLEIWRDDLNEI